jgi:hypothetical protein
MPLGQAQALHERYLALNRKISRGRSGLFMRIEELHLEARDPFGNRFECILPLE